MSLSPEVRAFLDWGQKLGERLAGAPLHEQRQLIGAALEEWASDTKLPVATVAAVEDFAVPVDGGSILLRVYTPPGDGPHPAFFHIHGGGFTVGSVDWLPNAAKCAHVCHNARCVVATVEYRLAPECPFPTAPEDCYSALVWLADHAFDLNVDPARIGVGGESAGGDLAAVLALMTRDRGGPSLALQLLEMPVTDMGATSGDYPSMTLFAEGYGLERVGIDAFQDAYLPNRADRELAYASPLHAGDLTGLPPAHVITAELDPLRDSGEAYARRLQEAGVRTTVHRFLGQTHGSSSLWHVWPPAREWMDEVVGAIRESLAFTPSEPPPRRRAPAGTTR
ncbi:MAG TPA: alpha/beta hydrolase [Gaiellaceae bacterium]|nr:alpha/beta hydrolase [Gaiellaceae bacterium]